MKCPQPKCKGGPRLETKKTFDEQSRVRRVKYCPKCHTRVETVEMFSSERDREIAEGKARERHLESEIDNRQTDLFEVRDAVQVLLRQVPPPIAPTKKGRKR
jgi:transcriptional regulator NrdR family protein